VPNLRSRLNAALINARWVKIAQRFALRSYLLCVKAKMVGIAQDTFEQEHGLIQFFRDVLACAS
jgi:hypothetical protein